MSGWNTRKRVWDKVSTEAEDDGFSVRLDGRQLKTPAKATLLVPTQALATEIANEWDAQGDEVDPLSMPATRAANAAIDKVAPQFNEVAELIAAYGDSDLLCYRASSPQELCTRQAEAWDPILEWAASALGAKLKTRSGIMHMAQDPAALGPLRDRVLAMDTFRLAAFHDLVGLSGSLVLGFAAADHLFDGEEVWRRSRIDEDWQAEQWGRDDEADAVATAKRKDFLNALKFYDLASA